MRASLIVANSRYTMTHLTPAQLLSINAYRLQTVATPVSLLLLGSARAAAGYRNVTFSREIG